MTSTPLGTDPFVLNGLKTLTEEAFGPSGFAKEADEVLRVVVFRENDTLGWGQIISESGTRSMGWGENQFSREALEVWLTDLRTRTYSRGQGAWTTAEVHLYPGQPGRLEVFVEEHLWKMSDGDWYPGGEPARAALWSDHLLRFPRTADNIPAWMWDIFRAEGVTPPIYNPDLKTVDWENKRLPVTDSGTDFSVDPVIIDPSKGPGFFSKIGARLFGN